ncbi:MAG TPA: hypothetical protein VIV40_02635 [Kofleriaceae bacterium]
MRWLLPCALLLVGCAKGGVELVFNPPTAVTKVVLFVGVGDEYTEPIMPAQHSLPYPKSSAWARDHYNELDERDVTPGEPVVFQFQGEGKLGVVIAIGLVGEQAVVAGVQRGIDIPTDSVARYELVLEPVNTTGSPLELTGWESQAGSPKAGKQCVALFDKRTLAADAVVTDGDPDCDGWPTEDSKECQPNFYMSYARPHLEEVACLVNERVVSTDGTVSDGCVLGGPPCRDGVGKEGGCTAPSAYCTPKSVCNRCNLTANPWDCARDITPLALQYPSHLHCKLFVDVSGQLCTTSFRAMSTPPMNIGGHYCKTDSEHPARITTIGQAWSTGVDFNENSSQLHVDIKNLQPNCNFDIQVSGSIEQGHSFGALVAGALDNGRGIAVPIVFEFNPTTNIGCDNQVACQATWSWDLSELVDQCVNTPAFPP